MQVPSAFDEAYQRFRTRTSPMGLGEMLRLLRSPDLAAALELMVAVVRALRAEPESPTGS